MNIAIYCRVSTGHQNESLDSQQVVCHSLIKEKFSDTNNNVTVYEDIAKSGKDIKHRGELQRLIADIKSGVINTVVVSRFDRSFRNVRQALDFFDLCYLHKVDFISKKENFDTTQAMGKAMLQISLVFAEMERGIISERLKVHNVARMQQGRRANGSVPYGYNQENKNLVVNKDESKIVKLMFKKYLELGSYAKVRDFLNGQKIPITKNNYLRKKYISTEWQNSTVRVILTNRTYIGDLVHNTKSKTNFEILGKGAWTPIVNTELFEKCQKLIEKNRTTKRNALATYNDKIPYVFSGLVFCEKCDCSMVGSSTIKRNKDRSVRTHSTYYRCKKCGLIIPSKKIDEQFQDLIDHTLNTDKTFQKSAKDEIIHEALKIKTESEDKLIRLNNELNALHEQKSNLFQALGKTDNTEHQEQINTLLLDTDNKISSIKWEIFNAQEYIDESNYIEAAAEDYYRGIQQTTMYHSLNAYDKKDLVQKIFRKIVVKDKNTIEQILIIPDCTDKNRQEMVTHRTNTKTRMNMVYNSKSGLKVQFVKRLQK